MRLRVVSNSRPACLDSQAAEYSSRVGEEKRDVSREDERDVTRPRTNSRRDGTTPRRF